MRLRLPLLFTSLILALLVDSSLGAQGLTPRDEARRDSLDQLRKELVRANEALPKYGIPGIDRLFRYEPPEPYNNNRGYDFLHAVAASRARNRSSSGNSSGGTLSTLIDLAVGKNFELGKWEIGVDGLIYMLPESNAIDGQWLGYELLLVRHLGMGRNIRLRSSNNYALKSQHWYTENHLILYYAPRLNGLFNLSVGRTSRESFHLTPEEIYRGYFASLPGANSPLRDYVKDFAHLRNRISLGEGLDLSTSLLYENRKPQAGLPLEHHRALIASGQILWAPSFLNATESGIPIPIGFRRELGLSYKQAIDPRSSAEGVPYSRYQQLEAFVRGTILFDRDNKLDVKLLAGAFLSRQRVASSDEKFFSSLPLLGRTPLRDGWVTLSPFFSGGDGWTTQEVHFNSNNLLLSRTKGIGEFFRMDEALHARNLLTKDGRAFSELGYSLGWGELARFGLFAGYDWMNTRAHVAFRVSLPILCLASTWSERR